MEIEFGDSKLRKLCETRREATRKLGADSARRLRTRLSEIHAAATVGELFAGNPHSLTGDREGEYAVNLAGGKRLVFVPNDNPIPTTESGHIDWPRVSSVKVVFVGDYHA